MKIMKEHMSNLLDQSISLKETIKTLQNEKAMLQSEIEDHTYNYVNISKNEKLFKQSTGLEVEAFEHLYNLVDAGENSENIKLYRNKISTTENDKNNSNDASTSSNSTKTKEEEKLLCIQKIKCFYV